MLGIKIYFYYVNYLLIFNQFFNILQNYKLSIKFFNSYGYSLYLFHNLIICSLISVFFIILTLSLLLYLKIKFNFYNSLIQENKYTNNLINYWVIYKIKIYNLNFFIFIVIIYLLDKFFLNLYNLNFIKFFHIFIFLFFTLKNYYLKLINFNYFFLENYENIKNILLQYIMFFVYKVIKLINFKYYLLCSNWISELIIITIPILIILYLLFPSFCIIYEQNNESLISPVLFWKITAHQWYWEHELFIENF